MFARVKSDGSENAGGEGLEVLVAVGNKNARWHPERSCLSGSFPSSTKKKAALAIPLIAVANPRRKRPLEAPVYHRLRISIGVTANQGL